MISYLEMMGVIIMLGQKRKEWGYVENGSRTRVADRSKVNETGLRLLGSFTKDNVRGRFKLIGWYGKSISF